MGNKRKTPRQATSSSAGPVLIIIKFRDNSRLPYEIGAERQLEDFGLGKWEDLPKPYQSLTISPLVTAASSSTIKASIERANRMDPQGYNHNALLSYFGIHCPPEISPQRLIEVLRSANRKWNSIENIYQAPRFVGANDYIGEQNYLNPAPPSEPLESLGGKYGIDTKHAWGKPNGAGNGQDFILIEEDWPDNHSDLPNFPPSPVLDDPNFPIPTPTKKADHGAAILGIVCALDDGEGCIGIAPKVSSVNVISYSGNALQPSKETAYDAVFKSVVKDPLLLSYSPFGSILLLPLETTKIVFPGEETPGGLPIETDDAMRLWVRWATALGMVVVIAAGNGKEMLGPLAMSQTENDSGAIVVGAADALTGEPLGHSSNDGSGSNVGGRINCYAWGNSVFTTAWANPFLVAAEDEGGTNYIFENGELISHYQKNFGGTSAASAIIAGAALIVQGLAQYSSDLAQDGEGNDSNLSRRLNSWQMRAILSDPANGTPSYLPNHPIGVMPDLRKIIDNNVLGKLPDLYMRDFVGDDGVTFYPGSHAASPDILVRDAELKPDEKNKWVGGKYTDPPSDLGDSEVKVIMNGNEYELDRDYYFYIRAFNRGRAIAVKPKVRIYWASAATIITLNQIKDNLIGEITLDDIPVGTASPEDVTSFISDGVVADPIVWQKNPPATPIPTAKPTPGHHCFIALVGNDLDPAPMPANFTSWQEFDDQYVNFNNNVALHNVVIVGNQATGTGTGTGTGTPPVPDPNFPLPPKGFVATPFSATGAPDLDANMGLEFIAKLPEGSKIALEFPAHLRQHFQQLRPDAKCDDQRTIELPLNPYGRKHLGEVFFAARADYPMRLLVHIPPDKRHNTYEVYVRQSYRGREVGRITWQLTPPRKRKRKTSAKQPQKKNISLL
jgi:serine protease